MGLNVIILAAGKGTRMRSSLPKVLHPVAGVPMVQHVINAANAVNAETINLVYGYGGEKLQQSITDKSLTWVLQQDQLGTGHAVAQAIPEIADSDTVLILYGDVPLISSSTLQNLLATKPENGIALLTVVLDNPTGYGRILKEGENVIGIREHKDASELEKLINEVNTGIMAVNGEQLKVWLSNLSNDNAQGEYYLTDIIEMAHHDGVSIVTAQPSNVMEVEGANNRIQLAALEREYQRLQAEQLMIDGATLLDPARVDVRGNVRIGSDVVIDINVIFEGTVVLGDGVEIGANCILKDCTVGANTVVKPNSMIDSSDVGADCTLGPYARLRPDSRMMDNSHVGNFVEMKKSTLGEGSKANHLTYLGDAEIGKKVNIGAGTITCNYDGANKFKTIINDGAFIGSNSSLVAPVTIGTTATVGAGSTINKDVDSEVLAVARGKQIAIKGWKRPQKKSKE